MSFAGLSGKADISLGAGVDQDQDRPYRHLGRRRGRRLRSAQRSRLERMLPHIQLIETSRNQQDFDPRVEAFEKRGPVWLEIGFGRGEHLAAQAQAHPEVAFIGIEPYLNGVAAALGLIEQASLSNVRFVVDDARNFLPKLVTGSISRIFVLFPDPWPKNRHHGRRLFSVETVSQMVRVLEIGGDVRVATDHSGYAEWVRRILAKHPEARMREAVTVSDGHFPAGWVKTRYQEKAERMGKPIIYFRFQRDPMTAVAGHLAVND